MRRKGGIDASAQPQPDCPADRLQLFLGLVVVAFVGIALNTF